MWITAVTAALLRVMAADAFAAPGSPVVDAIPESAARLRDPFKPAASIAVSVEGTELERYPIDQMKLVGVSTGPDKLVAMVQVPTGATFVVRETDKLGPHKGVVSKIESETLVVVEKIMNVLGQEESTESRLTMEALSKFEKGPASSGTTPGGGATASSMFPVPQFGGGGGGGGSAPSSSAAVPQAAPAPPMPPSASGNNAAAAPSSFSVPVSAAPPMKAPQPRPGGGGKK